ncbi:MAG: selenocysteine-specific translation elongation factor [Candidatus Marinimicrobia bacterium]|nr:selenocysteine-specific translation elongation factor [Candidatus Neomarinimicrobiota bacterium]
MKEIIIGLSGHIDHGKTSLIKSLTNKFSGTLKEDENRGMTIDLGVAFLDKNITLIDVPGHEDFIKNMMSGIHSIDIGLLVIAADDGIMPQTIEHFNILKLLNISDLIIVINKIDLADFEIIDIIKLEILDLIKDTKYENSNILEVSTLDNIGIDKLKYLLMEKSQILPNKLNRGAFRLPIDRFFSIKGFGTVVTGTVMSGSAKIGDELYIQPINKSVKIRGLNSHNSSLKRVVIGQRAAINIQNIDINNIKRGFQIVSKNFFMPLKSIITKINILNEKKFFIKKNQRIRVHLGTSEVIGKIFLFNQKKINQNQTSIVLINFEKPIIGSYKDKFIIRHYSPVYTIGGGEIILSSQKHNFGKKLSDITTIIETLNDIDDDYIETIISIYNHNPILLNNLCYQLGYYEKNLLELLESYKNIIIITYLNKKWVLTNKQLESVKDLIVNFINDFFIKNPYETSINRKIINNQLDIQIDFIDYLLMQLFEEKKIKKQDSGWTISNYKINLSNEEQKLKNMILDILDNEIFNTSSIEELGLKCKVSDSKLIINILKICESEKLVIRINQNLFITSSNMVVLKNKLINFFKIKKTINISEFKNLINSSRKYAIPILEYLDKIKFTYRDNNERRLS